jgi:putative ABC transport system permease protein
MRGLWLLSWRHLAHHRLRTAILVVCIALATFLPVTVQVLIARYESDLTARARATPMVAGARGNRFDLTLTALYFRQSRLDPIPYSELAALSAGGQSTAIPIHARFSARGWPIVGTSPDYYRLRALRPAAGTLPLRLGDVLLGSELAAALALAPGGYLFSDPTDLYDIAKPPTLKMRVCGVLPRTGTPDDSAALVDVKTCWILEGIAHGHGEADKIDPAQVLARQDRFVDVGPTVIPYQEVTDENIASFHVHADDSKLPLSALLVVPQDDKAGTLLKARLNASRTAQMVVPTEIVEELLHFVFRIKAILDAFALVLGATTLLLLILQLGLSMRLREREMATLHRIGCSPLAVAGLYLTEIALIVGFSLALAAGGVILAQAVVPDLVRAL